MSQCVGDCGAKRLAIALSCNNLLLYLNLSNNRIGVEGGKAIARSLCLMPMAIHQEVYYVDWIYRLILSVSEMMELKSYSGDIGSI
jgi:hypothetical protein